MNKQIKLFQADNNDNLRKQVNEFLKNKKPADILNINSVVGIKMVYIMIEYLERSENG